MREIKFRAWGKNIKEFLSPDGYPYGLTLKEIQNIEDIDLWEFQQFTGLKDKNGKEIYEGDIVSGNICDSFIKFDNFIVENLTGAKFEVWNGINTVFDLHDVYECEVIGNTLENPELIN